MTDYDLEEKADWKRGVQWITSRPITWRKIPAFILYAVYLIITSISVLCEAGMKRLYQKETGNWWL